MLFACICLNKLVVIKVNTQKVSLLHYYIFILKILFLDNNKLQFNNLYTILVIHFKLLSSSTNILELIPYWCSWVDMEISTPEARCTLVISGLSRHCHFIFK